MDALALNLLLSVAALASSPDVKIGDKVLIRSGDHEGCSGKVERKNGHECGMFVVCGEDVHWEYVNQRHLEKQ